MLPGLLHAAVGSHDAERGEKRAGDAFGDEVLLLAVVAGGLLGGAFAGRRCDDAAASVFGDAGGHVGLAGEQVSVAIGRAEQLGSPADRVGDRQVLVRLLPFVLLGPLEVRLAAQVDRPDGLFARRVWLETCGRLSVSPMNARSSSAAANCATKSSGRQVVGEEPMA